MAQLITTPQPWTIGQELVGTNGATYIATGPNSAKPKCPENEEVLDCCHYQLFSPTNVNPNALPPAPPAGAEKGLGNTVHVCHNNGSCYYTCQANGWVLDYCKLDPAPGTDCCHYHVNALTTTIQIGNPPQTPPGAPAGADKSVGDTAHVCYANAQCYYTCGANGWALDFCKSDSTGLVTYFSQSSATFDASNPPTAPNAPPAGPKQAGDTLVEKMNGALCFYTCTATAWVLDFCCPIGSPVPPEVFIGDSEPEKDANGGPYKVWFNCNDGCVYYCQEDGTWLAPKGCPQPAGDVINKSCALDASREVDGEIQNDCHYGDPGLVSARQVDQWLDLYLEFDANAINGFTNPCCNSVKGSTNSSADQCSQVEQSVDSTATGNHSSAISANNSEVTGSFAIVSGASNNSLGANNSFTTGARNEVSGNNSLNAGSDNVVTGVQGMTVGSANTNEGNQNVVGGGSNSLDVGSSGNSVNGTGNVLETSDFNDVVGNQNVVGNDSNNNQVGGVGNILDNADSNLIVGGPGNTLTGTKANVVGGGNHTVTGLGANLIVGNRNDHTNTQFNVTGGGNNITTDGQRNLSVGLQNTFIDATDMHNGGRVNYLENATSGILQGWFNCLRGTIHSSVIDSTKSENNGTQGATILASRGILNTQNWVVTGGAPQGAGGKATTQANQPNPVNPADTANRRWQIDSLTGNMFLSGGLTTGFVFPGFGEYAVVKEELESGLFVQYEGLDGAKVTDSADFDGISRMELAMSAGGGVPFDNSPFVLDDYGNRVFGDIDVEVEDLVIDEKATREAQSKLEQDVERVNAELRLAAKAKLEKRLEGEKVTEKMVDEVFNPVSGGTAEPVMKAVTKTIKEYGPLANEKFDPTKEVNKVGVEMMGRVWLQTTGKVAVGDYMMPSKGGVGVVSKEQTRVRVLAVEDGRAYVVIK